MRLKMRFDKDVDAWMLSHEDCTITTKEQVEEWKALLQAEFAKVTKHPAYLLVDLAGFDLDPSMAERYGDAVKKLSYSGQWAAVVRYQTDAQNFTNTTIRLQAVKNRFPSNIFPSREAALAALEEIKAAHESG
jgi:hypothetical protein